MEPGEGETPLIGLAVAVLVDRQSSSDILELGEIGGRVVDAAFSKRSRL